MTEAPKGSLGFSGKVWRTPNQHSSRTFLAGAQQTFDTSDDAHIIFLLKWRFSH
uniref:Uncharacterized protein n=1 Tax=Anguilla anguilla TaxID=7936 RepID=A0A0E9XA89_ANGAN